MPYGCDHPSSGLLLKSGGFFPSLLFCTPIMCCFFFVVFFSLEKRAGHRSAALSYLLQTPRQKRSNMVTSGLRVSISRVPLVSCCAFWVEIAVNKPHVTNRSPNAACVRGLGIQPHLSEQENALFLPKSRFAAHPGVTAVACRGSLLSHFLGFLDKPL